MFRSTLFSALLAAVVTPAGIFINSATHQPVQHDSKLTDSLSALTSTLVSFESRQTGSEQELTKQLKLLADSVADTQRASQSQIDSLTATIADVRAVATQAGDTTEFKELLRNFGTNFERKLESKIKAVSVKPDEGVGTLDVDSKPADGIGSIQTIPDAARRIIALEKEVAALKARSTVATSSTAYYPANAQVTSSYSGGSTGSHRSYSPMVVSSGYTDYGTAQPTYTPVYSYSAQPVYQQSAYQSQPQRWFGSRSSGTCRIVNGVQVCN